MTCRRWVVAGLVACCLMGAGACLAQEGAVRQKYSDWEFKEGTNAGEGFHIATYEAPATPGGMNAKGTVAFKCIVRANQPRYAYYVEPISNKCWCRYDFESAAFETVSEADQRKLGEINERAFRRSLGAPKVPGSDQITLAAPRNPAKDKAVP